MRDFFARSCSNIPLRNLLCLLDFTRLWLHVARQKQKLFALLQRTSKMSLHTTAKGTAMTDTKRERERERATLVPVAHLTFARL